MGRTNQTKSATASASQPVTKKELTLAEAEEKDVKVLKESPKKATASKSSGETPTNSSTNKNNKKAIFASKGKKNEVEEKKFEPPEELTKEDLEKGMNLLGAMSKEDFQTFLTKMDAVSPKIDKMKVKVRNGHINWNLIAFSNYGPFECRTIWEFLLTNARKFRIMSEVVQEFRCAVEHNPRYIYTLNNIPQPPPAARGGSQVYVRELWKMHQEECDQVGRKHDNWCTFYKKCQDGYLKLTEKEKEYYEKLSKKEYEKYQLVLQAYYKEHPNHQQQEMVIEKVPKVRKRKPTSVAAFPDAPVPPVPPYAYFVQSKLQKLETAPTAEERSDLKSKFVEKYKRLKDKKKAKWIDYTINYCQNYTKEVEEFQLANPKYCPKELKIKNVIKKSDITIWERFREKPAKPKYNVFAVFFEDFYQKEENADVPTNDRRRVAENAFRELDWYQKQMYKMNYRMSNMKYRKDIADYVASVPDVVKPLVIETITRKYRPSLIDVGKIPAGDMTEEEGVYKDDPADYTEVEEEAPSPKKKKSKKRKHDELSEADGLSSPTHSKTNNVGDESEELASDDLYSRVSRVKNKKKRKDGSGNAESSEPQEVEEQPFITGDLNLEDDDPNFIKIEAYSLAQTEVPRISPRTIVKKLTPMSPPKTILSNANVVPKPSASSFVSQKVGQQDIDDAVRGIFDGRNHLGRRFSVYYYYAKYVSQHKKWIHHSNLFGVLETADKIVATFIELSDEQKDIFIAQSYNFYLQRRYGITMKGTKKIYETDEVKDIFPGEPRPPPRSATKLYLKEVEYLTRKNVSIDFPKWEDLHVDVQMVFVKKLYRETQLYVKKFEEFVLNMSPNDMIEYVLFRARFWENKYLKEAAVSATVKGFVFPLPRNEMEGEGYESGPELVDDDMPGEISGSRVYVKKKTQQKMNPFAVERPRFKEVPKKKPQVQIGGVDEDADESCVSSDDEVRMPTMNFTKDQPNLRHLNEVKDYFFPMGVLTKKMLSPTKVQKRVSRVERERMRKAHEALHASRKIKMKKGKAGRILFKNRIKGVGIKPKEVKKKAKVRLPKQRNFNEGQKDGTKEPAQRKRAKVLLPKRKTVENVDLQEEVDLADSEAEGDNLDCSEFVRSLQSPQKSVVVDVQSVAEDFEDATATQFHVDVPWREDLDVDVDHTGSVQYEGGGLMIDEEDVMLQLQPFEAYASDIQQETDTNNLDPAMTGPVPVFDVSDLNYENL